MEQLIKQYANIYGYTEIKLTESNLQHHLLSINTKSFLYVLLCSAIHYQLLLHSELHYIGWLCIEEANFHVI